MFVHSHSLPATWTDPYSVTKCNLCKNHTASPRPNPIHHMEKNKWKAKGPEKPGRREGGGRGVRPQPLCCPHWHCWSPGTEGLVPAASLHFAANPEPVERSAEGCMQTNPGRGSQMASNWVSLNAESARMVPNR